MNNDIPTFGWILLVVFVIFVLSFNSWLWAAYKKRGKDPFINNLQDLGKKIKNPWIDEEKNVNELNKMVKELNNNKEEN